MRKFMKKTLAVALAGAMMLGAVGCGTKDETSSKRDRNKITKEEPSETEPEMNIAVKGDTACEDVDGGYYEEPFNTAEFEDVGENGWMIVGNSPLSTFSADVDTSSYTNIRSYLLNGYNLEPSMVRYEEMINYFRYDYETPSHDEKFAVHTEYTNCPWNKETKLALVSLNTEAIDFSDAPDTNIVFLIDTSGSMFGPDRLGLIQDGMRMLCENLSEKDRVSVVTYAGSSAVLLEGVSGDNYDEIMEVVDSLEASGSTNGSDGINTAYEIAEKYFIKGGNNVVVLATDGDLNVGVTSEGALSDLIEEKKESGVFLSVLGFGYENLKDNKLAALADHGNGNYHFIDSKTEARKALVEDMGANFVTVAKDVKLQVEFNPALVKGYRLIGYEKEILNAEDFENDEVDAGEMGAGHTVTAMYELVMADSDYDIGSVPELKYSQENRVSQDAALSNELFTVNVRYKEPDEDESKLIGFVCTTDDESAEGSNNLRWAAAVAAYGMILKESDYVGNFSKDDVVELAKSAYHYGSDEDEYKEEFIYLVKKY